MNVFERLLFCVLCVLLVLRVVRRPNILVRLLIPVMRYIIDLYQEPFLERAVEQRSP